MIHFLTPVWGGHLPLFIDVVIPALLSPGNLPSCPGSKYIIYTTYNGRRAIKNSTHFRQLSSTVEVVFKEVEPGPGCYVASTCYRRGVAAADGDPCVFLCPDIVFADGAFANMKRLAESYDVIYIPCIRTLRADVAAALPVGVSPRKLMKIAFDNLHPLAHTSFWAEYGPDFIPANLYWRVGDEGLVARCFHLHPLFVRPQVSTTEWKGTVDDRYVDVACPDATRDYIVTDSDELCAIELSGPEHYFKTDFRKGSTKDTAQWARRHAGPRHRMLFDRTIWMHTGIKDIMAWCTASIEADRVASVIKWRLGKAP